MKEYNPRENFEKKYNLKEWSTVDLIFGHAQLDVLYTKELEKQNKQMLEVLKIDLQVFKTIKCESEIVRLKRFIKSITGKKIEEVK